MKKVSSLFVFIFFLQYAQSQVLPVGSPAEGITVAGGNGSGSAANQIGYSEGFFVDASANIYIAEMNNHRVQKWQPGATAGITVAGGNGPGSAADQLDAARSVFVDASGNVYVSDYNNHRIQKWAPGASAGVTVAGGRGEGSAADQLRLPTEIFIDPAGYLYVADAGNARIQKFAPGSSMGITVAGGNGYGSDPNKFNGIGGFFIDAGTNIYVADIGNHRVQKWAPGASQGFTVAGGRGRGPADNQLNNPNNVYVDQSGNIFIADLGNNRIQKWSPGASKGITVAGGNGRGFEANQLANPTDIFIDPSGNIYVNDGGNFRIQKFSSREVIVGSPATGITVAGGVSYNPLDPNWIGISSGISVDSNGNLYVADETNDRIQKFAPGATAGVTVAGGNDEGMGANQLHDPSGVFVDASGNLYVADGDNYRVQKFTPGAADGITVAGGNGSGAGANQLSGPSDVFVDSQGYIYISDWANNRIQKWSPGASEGVTVAGGNGNGSAANQLRGPNSVFVDAIGNIYVSDGGNSRIQKWAPGALAGVTVAGGFNLATRTYPLSNPAGIFVDKAGNIFVADQDNDRIQKFAPGASEGITVAGGNGEGKASNQFSRPSDVYIDNNGDMYVADQNNFRVQKFAADGLSFKYYEGNFTTLPDFNILTPVKTGNSANVDITTRTPGRNDNFAFVWEGKINIPTAGTYTFETISDDGSNFYFNSKYLSTAVPTVNNDGLHASKSAKGSIDIAAAGEYPVAITFFENSGDEQMQVYWKGPGIPRQLIPDAAFSTVMARDNFAPDVPLNLHIVSKGGNFISLDWDDATDNVGVIAYDVYVGGVLKYSSHESQLTADSLSPNTSYSFTVKARDLAGKTSLFSNTATESTTGTTNGLLYKYYEGAFETLPDFNTLTPVATGSSLNVDVGVRPPGRTDNFAFVWEGYINIPAPGMYTFETVSDDGSKVYFNTLYNPSASPIVSNDGLHPPSPATGNVYVGVAGIYPISITFFEKDGGEQMQVYWTGPGIERQIIPNAAFQQTPPPPQNGLGYKYYEGNWDALPDFNALTPLKSGSSNNVDIGVRTPGRNDNFAFMWEGYIHIPKAGEYTFETVSDDGSKLYFNSLYDPLAIPTVNNDGIHAPYPATGMVNIPVPGIYPISITFFEKDGGEQMQLYWTGPGMARQLIPNSAFIRTPPASSPDVISARQLESQDGKVEKTNIATSRIYPNSFRQTFNIDFYNSSAGNDIRVGIYDLKGRLVYQQHAGKMPGGQTTFKVNLDGYLLPKGVYMAQLWINNASSKMFKVVKVQ